MKRVKRNVLRQVFLAVVLAMVPSLARAAVPPAQKPEGLIGYWKLDEGVGQMAYDYSGGQTHGELIGKVDWETGEHGPGLRFDGKTGYVNIPDGPWNVSAPVTFWCWYRAEATAGNVFDHAMSGAIPGTFALSAGGQLTGYDAKGVSKTARLSATTGQWVFAAVTIDLKELRSYVNGELQQTVAVADWPRTDGALSLGARGCGPDRYFAGQIREMAVFNRVLGAAEIAAGYARYQQGQPLYQPAPGLKLLAVRPERHLYRPQESAPVVVTVKNFAPGSQSATLVVNCVSRLATSQEVFRQTIALTGLESRVFQMAVPFQGQSFGCAVEAQLIGQAGVFDQAQGFVGVAENAWLVGIGGRLDPSALSRSSDAGLDAIIKRAREHYANWLEMFFWAPDDWGNLNPTVAEWYSGQASYFMNRAKLRDFIGRAHAQGIRMVTYGKHNACGPDGYELARKKPEWFRPYWADVRQLDEWNDKPARARPGARFDWAPLFPDFRRVDALDYGIAQIADSAATFGWDGVRFDGHYTVSSDAVSAWNIRRLKETVWARHPNFLFGFNYSFAPDSYAVVTREMQEAMAGAGMWMQEAITQYGYGTGGGMVYDHWTQSQGARPAFAPHELAAAKQVSAMGGQYHCILGLDAAPASVYKLIYSLIAGAHSVYGSHENVPGCGNWGKFMTRWSAFLWHPRLKVVAHPTARVTVDAPGLYWQPLLQEFNDTPARKFTVIHLVNPSPDDKIKQTTLPAPVAGIRLRITPSPGATIQRVVLIRPECEPYDQELERQVRAGQCEVLVPQVSVWAMVVVEESGRFTVPADLPRFAEPVNAAELAAGRAQANAALTSDPLQPPAVGLALAVNEWLYETDTGYNSVSAQEASDPDALNGRAQVRDSGVESIGCGRTYLGSFPPGRYQVRVRMKLTDEQNPPRRQTVRLYGQTQFYGVQQPLPQTTFDSDEQTPPERRLIIDGKYHDYTSVAYELREQCLINQFIAPQSVTPAGNRFYVDHIIVKQLERYTDQQLAAWSPPDKPAALRVPQGRSPQKILHVRGLYWPFYKVEELVGGATGVYELPQKYEDLYAYDAVVLSNASLPGGFRVRRMMRDFVEDGGRLVILGGPATLGQAAFTGTCLAGILPFVVRQTGTEVEVVPCAAPTLLGPQAGQSWSDQPAIFWRHPATLQPGTEALAFAGNDPIAARSTVGQGLIAVFAGTVLGNPPAAVAPFWQTDSWARLLKRLVTD